MSEITFKGIWDDNDPPDWEVFTVMLHGAEAGDWVPEEDVAATLARNGWQCGPILTLSAAMELPEVRALVDAATALLVQVDGLIPIKHPQQKLERNKLRHAITALAAIKEPKT